MRSRHFISRVLPPLVLLAFSSVAAAQDASAKVGSDYVPGDAVITAVFSVASTLNSPQAEMYPVEIVDAWCQQQFGIPARQIDRVKLIVGAPGPGDSMFALVVTSLRDFDLSASRTQFVNTSESVEVDGYSCYRVPAAPGTVVHALDAKTLVFATANYLGSVVRAAEPSESRGPLARMAAGVTHSGNLTLLIAIEPIRPMALGMLQAQGDRIPPPLKPFTRIPELLDAVLVKVNLETPQNNLQLVMPCRNEAAAQEMLGIIQNGLQMGRGMALAQTQDQLDPNDPLAEASLRYAQRISSKIVEWLTPKLEGRRLVLRGSVTEGIATQGVLVGLLLPAVQAAREAARRTSSANNLRQIGLAMHNYHDTHGHFPGDIKSSEGTPLLSWRVSILPYLGESGLYEQFKKDEPWDSPHNSKLAPQMPTCFVHPGMQTSPDTTVYQRPLGPNFIMDGSGEVGIRNITDGSSNTVMVVETRGEVAVPWTKPADVTIDPNNVLAQLVDETTQGFNTLFADGSVRFIASSIDPTLFQALLTRNGGEVVGP